MKRYNLWAIAALAVSSLLVGVSLAGIEGSKHDFSHEDWTGGDACAACHTPHNELPPTKTPRWNPAADLNTTFGTASPRQPRKGRRDQSGSSQPTGQRQLAGRRDRPAAGTRTCLRCHDGAIANDLVPESTRRSTPNTFHPGKTTTGHGSTDHPVGIAYPSFERGYHPPSAVVTEGTVTLPAGKVECISCHDPHDQAKQLSMLVKSNSRSALRLTCHRK